jgi:hypothetical protein
MTDTVDTAPAAEKPEKEGAAGAGAKDGTAEEKKKAVGYHYWHQQANQGTAPKVGPLYRPSPV